MFSMCSELTPRARIPDTRIPQLMQPWMLLPHEKNVWTCVFWEQGHPLKPYNFNIAEPDKALGGCALHLAACVTPPTGGTMAHAHFTFLKTNTIVNQNHSLIM